MAGSGTICRNERRPGVRSAANQTRAGGMKFVPIVDSATSVVDVPGSSAFANGKMMDVFVTWPQKYIPEYSQMLNKLYEQTNGTGVMLGVVWPDNHTAFPDFFRTNASAWWRNELDRFKKLL